MSLSAVPEGVQVRITHLRAPLLLTKAAHQHFELRVRPKGGITVAALYDADGCLLVTAYAMCSHLDNYNRRLGRTIALGRAVKKLEAKRWMKRR